MILKAFSPYRLSFYGGGTDIDFYYKKKPGLFLTCAFNQGIYVSVSKRPLDKKILIQTTDTQFCYSINQIKHEIIREVLRYFNVKNQIQINCFSTLGPETFYKTCQIRILYSEIQNTLALLL